MSSFFPILHVVAVIALTSQAFTAFSHPDPAARKRTLILSGLSAFVTLASGAAMIHRLYQGHVFGWMIIKLICLGGVAALAGQAYRHGKLRAFFAMTTLTLLLIALAMVYTKPF